MDSKALSFTSNSLLGISAFLQEHREYARGRAVVRFKKLILATVPVHETSSLVNQHFYSIYALLVGGGGM